MNWSSHYEKNLKAKKTNYVNTNWFLLLLNINCGKSIDVYIYLNQDKKWIYSEFKKWMFYALESI